MKIGSTHMKVVSTALIFMPLIVSAAMFLQVDGIPGESTDGNHINWIAVSNFSHGVVAGTPEATHYELTVTYKMDKSAPTLNIRACDQMNISSVKLETTQDADTSKWIYQVNLEDAVVSSVTTMNQNDGVIMVSVSFLYDRIQWRYQTYTPGGSPNGVVECGWNVATNAAW